MEVHGSAGARDQQSKNGRQIAQVKAVRTGEREMNEQREAPRLRQPASTDRPSSSRSSVHR
jgi:hypothetical protein